MVFGPNDEAGRAADRKEIGMNRIFKLFCVSVAVASTLTTAAMAQWSIGQPGSREPPRRLMSRRAIKPTGARAPKFSGSRTSGRRDHR
jgi:hypothetical protein